MHNELEDIHFLSPADVSPLVADVTCERFTPFDFYGITSKDLYDALGILWALTTKRL